MVQSYRFSSMSNTIFSVLQRFVRSYRVGGADHEGEGCDIAFWTISKGEVPTNSNNVDDAYLEQNGLKVVENAYYERGNFNLSYLPHSQSGLIYNVEILFDNKLLKLLSANIRLQNAMDVTKLAAKHFDRSEEVDEAVMQHYIDVVLPNVNVLNLAEANKIEKCKKDLGWGTIRHINELNAQERAELRSGETDINAWERMPGSVNDVVEKFRTMNDTITTVKGIVKVDENIEVIFAWMMHTNSNERIAAHLKNNGNTERTLQYDHKTHTSYATSEIPIPLIPNRQFSVCLTWKRGWNGNLNAYVIAVVDDKEEGDPGTTSNGAVIGSSTALYTLETISSRVTLITQIQKLI